MIGKTLAHYRIIEQLGKGGMGEVYRATDTHLGRDVALKILPREFSEDAERCARFEREARTLAALQHPNVASVYGFEEADGVRFLVMELAQGEDLGKQIERGLSVDDAVAIAVQIAHGLEAAHDAGIVHRDLKPANVQIAADGSVKLLDFGLARAWDEDGAAADPLNSPTITGGMTAHGVIMGTAAYMSPEQARGRNVDRQADVWALGCVLYEMLSGKVAYQGDTVTDTLAAIIHRDPDWKALPANTPRYLRHLLKLCLQKAPPDRLRDARDVRLLLMAPGETDAQAQQPVITTRAGRLWPSIAGLLAAALILTLALGRSATPPEPAPKSDIPRISSMQQLTDRVGAERDPSLSPDARMLLFAARDAGDFDIFLQRVGGENPINLTADHDGDDRHPSFSPDGQRIAFSSSREGGGIFVMGATGEHPQRMADFGFDPAWSPDGRSLVVTEENNLDPYGRRGLANLWIIDLETRDKRRLHEIDATGPSWAPGGHRIAFWSHLETVKGQRDIYTIDVDGQDPKAVTLDAATDWDPVWSPDGRWLYFFSDRGGSRDLWRQRIDQVSGEAIGLPQPVTAGVTQLMQMAMAQNGQMALVNEDTGAELLSIPFDLETLSVTGEPVSTFRSNNALAQLDASPDGEWIAYRTTAPDEYLYLMRSDGTARRQIVASPHRNRGPKFMPGSDWLIFYSNRSQVYQVWAVRRDGSGLRQLTNNPEQDITAPMVSTDGRILCSYEDLELTLGELKLPGGGIEAMNTPTQVEAIKQTFDFTAASASESTTWLGGFSADTGAVAIYSMQAGTMEIVTLDGEPLRTSDDPIWLDDRRMLFWESSLGSVVVWDAERRSAMLVHDLPGPAVYVLLRGKRALLANMQRESSEIWLVTMEDKL